MKVDLIKVYTDDYEAVYVNGKSEYEGHSIHLDEVIRGLIGKEVNSFYTYYIDGDVLEEKYGESFPDSFDEFNKGDLE